MVFDLDTKHIMPLKRAESGDQNVNYKKSTNTYMIQVEKGKRCETSTGLS